MKYFNFLLICILMIFISCSNEKKCTGKQSCKVCKDCSRCKHCNEEGGMCGVCGDGEDTYMEP